MNDFPSAAQLRHEMRDELEFLRLEVAKLKDACQWAEMRLPEQYRDQFNIKRTMDPRHWYSRKQAQLMEAPIVLSEPLKADSPNAGSD